MMSSVLFAAATVMSVASQHAAVLATGTQTCKCIPGDDCWPTAQEWEAFNATVSGKLVTPRQLASACHNPDYDEATCQYVREQWTQPYLHDESPSSIMAAAVANGTCDPFTARELPCEPGPSVTYAVNATDASDFTKAITFARDNNLRLVIRNTGHDYLGKSTGKWALSVWTHHMKDTEYMPSYSSEAYVGPAMKIGAGIQVEEAYTAAHALGHLVVGGDCATVGVAGGYLQGGGHSALSSMYGMAVDHVLEWEVVDGTGKLVRASPTENSDLYWALSGGGAGTYGIVVSVVVKLQPDIPIAGVQLQFDLDPDSPDAFYSAVSKYHELVPTITSGPYYGMGIAEITNTSFLLTPLTLPDVTEDDARQLLAPLVDQLNDDGLEFNLTITESPNWLEYWQTLIKPNPTQLVQNAQYGGWMVPRTIIDEQSEDLQSAIQDITDAGCVFVSLALDVSDPDTQKNVSIADTQKNGTVGPQTRNSVLPAWREAALYVILSTSWPAGANLGKMQLNAETMTQTCVRALSDLAPDAGAYMNEADPNQPDWQKAFYGTNYDRLLAIKNTYDPDHLFYATTAVGSDYYNIDVEGRLCQADV